MTYLARDISYNHLVLRSACDLTVGVQQIVTLQKTWFALIKVLITNPTSDQFKGSVERIFKVRQRRVWHDTYHMWHITNLGLDFLIQFDVWKSNFWSIFNRTFFQTDQKSNPRPLICQIWYVTCHIRNCQTSNIHRDLHVHVTDPRWNYFQVSWYAHLAQWHSSFMATRTRSESEQWSMNYSRTNQKLPFSSPT